MQHSTEDAFMVPGMGAQNVRYVATNDNVAMPEMTHKEWERHAIETGFDWVSDDNRPIAISDYYRGAVQSYFDEAVGEKECGPFERMPFIQFQPHDDLVTTTFAPLESVGWPVVTANSPGNSNQFDGIGERHGDFMQTYTGRKFWPMDARANEVCIRDIAHSLSLQCRYAGHCRRFYSVAEHSVHIARWLVSVAPEAALWGLMHDASEAYLVDIPRPVKPYLTNYKEAEAKVMAAVCARFGLPLDMPVVVHEADNRIIADELVNLVPMDWHARHDDPLDVPLQYWSPAEAEEEFLATFRALTGAVVGEVW